MTRSSRTLAVATGMAVLLLSGCGSGQLRPGAAALVGSERIATDSLRAIVERGLADPAAQEQLGQDRPGFQRQALTRLINRELLAEAAERKGVSVTDGEVDDLLQDFVLQAGGREALEEQAAQSGISPQDLPRFVEDIALDQKLGDALTADIDVPRAQLTSLYQENIAQYDRVRSRHILVPDEKTARTILTRVKADPSTFAPLAAQFSTDTSNKDRGGDLGLVGRGQFVPEFEKLLFSAKPDTYDVVGTQFGFHVVHVVGRETTSLAEATPELRRGALQAQRQERSQELLREVGRDLGVKVNPRFGRWDAERGTVEPIEDPNGVTTQAPESGGEEQLPEGGAPEGGAPEGEQAPLIEEAPAPEGEAPVEPSPAG